MLTLYVDIFLLSILRRSHKLFLKEHDMTTEYKNIARLNIWVCELIPANFNVLIQRENRMFESVEMLTSSADFIKAVRTGDIEQTRAVLKLNVSIKMMSTLATSY
jgi:hypothetical protein